MASDEWVNFKSAQLKALYDGLAFRGLVTSEEEAEEEV